MKIIDLISDSGIDHNCYAAREVAENIEGDLFIYSNLELSLYGLKLWAITKEPMTYEKMCNSYKEILKLDSGECPFTLTIVNEHGFDVCVLFRGVKQGKKFVRISFTTHTEI